MTADFSYSLEALERRWQVEKTPQVGLRLAEEHRRKGDLDASIETLAAGLEVYPSHTASRVALSRYLVDGERFAEAVGHLEKIVALDPAHLVANKLLVGAYVGVGRVEDARDKLAIYEMMGEGDSDIERLQDLVGDAEAKAAPPAVSVAAAERSHPVEPEADLAESMGETVGGEDGGPSAGDEDGDEDGDGEPAPGTRGGTSDPLPTPAAPQAPDSFDEDPFDAPPPASSRAAFAGAAESSGETGDEPFGEALEGASSPSYWERVADEGIFLLEQDEGEASEPETNRAERAEEAALDDPDARDDAAAEIGSESSTSGAAAGSTVTLGKLYLQQGHREQAAEAFEEVLSREPDNQAARRELEAVTKREPEVGPADSTAKLADRRRAVLTNYRDRLRKASAAGV